MAKSKRRKGARPFRGKPVIPVYRADPMTMLVAIGKGELSEQEEDAACKLLLYEMSEPTDTVLAAFRDNGLTWPPTTNDDIRAIARALVKET